VGDGNPPKLGGALFRIPSDSAAKAVNEFVAGGLSAQFGSKA